MKLLLHHKLGNPATDIRLFGVPGTKRELRFHSCHRHHPKVIVTRESDQMLLGSAQPWIGLGP
jgi:hypothetical protein